MIIEEFMIVNEHVIVITHLYVSVSVSLSVSLSSVSVSVLVSVSSVAVSLSVSLSSVLVSVSLSVSLSSVWVSVSACYTCVPILPACLGGARFCSFMRFHPGALNSAKFRGGGGWRGNPRYESIFKRVHFLAFLREAIKKGLYLR